MSAPVKTFIPEISKNFWNDIRPFIRPASSRCPMKTAAKFRGFHRSASGAHIDADSVKRYALENGPVYQHPRRIHFLNELPWAGTNKIDRNALKQHARDLEAAGAWEAGTTR